MRYSPSTNGFYPDEVNYNKLPDDLIDIEDEYYKQLLFKQGQGKSIKANGNDKPVAEYSIQSAEEAIAFANEKKYSLLSEVSVYIAPLQEAVDLDVATKENVINLSILKKYRLSINQVNVTLAPDIVWPESPLPEVNVF